MWSWIPYGRCTEERICQGTHESWILKNSKAVMHAVIAINTVEETNSMRSWDLTNLYTQMSLKLFHENPVGLFDRFRPIGCYMGIQEYIDKDYFPTNWKKTQIATTIELGIVSCDRVSVESFHVNADTFFLIPLWFQLNLAC